MDLDTYLRENAIKGSDFALLIGITEASLSRIRRGQQNITRDTMQAIWRATEGKVALETLVFPEGDALGGSDHGLGVSTETEGNSTRENNTFSGGSERSAA